MIRNSTIIPKKKKLSCGCFDFNFSKNRCKAHANVANFNKRLEKHEEQEQDESLQNLIDDLDFIFSRYIRLKYANGKGKVQCFTCLEWFTVAVIQNGHFIHRADLATRWLEENCRPQCPHCNATHNDNPEIYRDRLEAEKKGIAEWLLEQSREVVKPTRDELKQMIIDYRHRVKLLESKLKTQNSKST